jgi:hypothetical protein
MSRAKTLVMTTASQILRMAPAELLCVHFRSSFELNYQPMCFQLFPVLT